MTRVAIVHDYLTQRGGAERVVLAMLRVFPDARIITSVFDLPSTYPEFGDYAIETTWLNNIALVRRHPRLALPVLSDVMAHIDLSDADVVIASSSGFAHTIRFDGPKIVYCYNPPRWLYQTTEYEQGLQLPARLALAALRKRLTRLDINGAVTAQRYLAISSSVSKRVLDAYGVVAQIVPPPVTTHWSVNSQAVADIESGFLLTIARPRGYKNTEVVIDAMTRMPNHRLVVVGNVGRAQNVWGVGTVTDAELRWLYENCLALVSLSYEDFGLTPLEANAFGKPAVVLRAGGFLDTVEEGLNGVFVNEPTADSLELAVASLKRPWDHEQIRLHAERFNFSRFKKSLLDNMREFAP